MAPIPSRAEITQATWSMRSHFAAVLVQDNLHAHAQNELIKNYQVPTMLLASMCRAMPFSARALKENIFFDVDIVIENVKIEIWFIVVCTLINNEYASLLFSQTLFSYCFCMLSDFAKVFERKVWRVQVAYCIMQRVHILAGGAGSPSHDTARQSSGEFSQM